MALSALSGYGGVRQPRLDITRDGATCTLIEVDVKRSRAEFQSELICAARPV